MDIAKLYFRNGSVCCFPYGVILDKTNALLDQVEFMLKGGDQDKVKWEPVALLAKKAALHYRTYLERTMEERLGEGLRLKAAQRIIRLDSFLVESTVSKLEKDANKWESSSTMVEMDIAKLYLRCVCCFPYGVILDKTNALLDQVEFMLKGGDQDKVKWEPVALLAKKAALHYRTYLERTMEERLGEGLRLKAAQRIIRLDSFLVESTVSKLEKDANKARDELRWELEQLQHQNAQLRKDNRQLKLDHMRLESRVEVLEQKFKTLARLLS
ncbi:hypothetical protein ANCDUO_06543 [Ancylostoma duodenale]|uniref:Uncharacterized protein n=1 Tax=Ancylostoma duodenale TaxID=51022 RepID=A0A0C2H181_9BILA|nr:hypothetical protein ANCDUO_06543 [Ancylostoma duodenale]